MAARAIAIACSGFRGITTWRCREAAASALGEIDSARAVPGLIAALGSEKVAAVRAKIAWALEHWAQLREAGDDLCIGTVESWLVFRLTGGLAEGHLVRCEAGMR